MKKNKIQNVPDSESIRQWRRQFALGKRKAAREKQKESDRLERDKIFERKTAQASDKKAPFTLRTRAYYRFSKDYPNIVDENGFRDNSPDKKSTVQKRIILAAVCVAVFAVAFVFARVGLLISEKPIKNAQPTQTTDTDSLKLRAFHFSYEQLRDKSASELIDILKEYDCNAAVFEFKDDKGYVIFNTGSFVGMSADKRIPDAEKKMKTVKTNGYTVCAYISCFKDSVISVADLSCSVRKNTFEGAAWLDNSGFGWLDPFSQTAQTYLIDIIKSASNMGFDRIILGNVCFSSDSGNATPCYAWESQSGLSGNEALLGFIGNAVKSSGNASLTVMCDISAFVAEAENDTPGYYGNLMSSAATSFCTDARLSVQKKNITIGTENFRDPSLMPYVFVLAAAENSVNACKNSKSDAGGEVLVCIENNDSVTEETAAVRYALADGYIIW